RADGDADAGTLAAACDREPARRPRGIRARPRAGAEGPRVHRDGIAAYDGAALLERVLRGLRERRALRAPGNGEGARAGERLPRADGRSREMRRRDAR